MSLNPVYSSLCEIPKRNSMEYPERISHQFRVSGDFSHHTWSEFYAHIQQLSAGFFLNDIKKDSHVGFFCDNRYEWTVTDYALLSIGGVSVPRGSDTTPKEQNFLFNHSDSEFLVMEKIKNLEELADEMEPESRLKIKKIFLMDTPEEEILNVVTQKYPELSNKIVCYSHLYVAGKEYLDKNPDFYEVALKKISKDDLATIIYTSGTSGNPKGVMLNHSNFLHNVRAISPLFLSEREKDECTVSILPSWHVYERAFEYCIGACAMKMVYSSIKNLTADLLSQKPHVVASVPRVWESFYQKVMDKIGKQPAAKRKLFGLFLNIGQFSLTLKNRVEETYFSEKKMNTIINFLVKILDRTILVLLYPLRMLADKLFVPIREIMGGNLRASFSGGGSLSPQVDLFFNTVGIRLVNAYGMTETSPGTITRQINRNTLGSIGTPLAETEVKIINEKGGPASLGEKGLIHVRGPQVMQGYYKNEEATKAILSPDGWLNTGDLGVMSASSDFVITGRAKSTIVLIGGENIEPEPIEEKLQESVFIEHAVVIGQDRKNLVALISVNEEKIKHLAKKLKISWNEQVAKEGDRILHSRMIQEIRKEIQRLISRDNGFRKHEHINDFVLLNRKFAIGEELTQTLKVKRGFVEKKYRHHLNG